MINIIIKIYYSRNTKKPAHAGFFLHLLVVLHRLKLSQLLHLLTLEGLLLPVLDRRGLLEIFPLLPFTDNSLFFYHSFESFERFLQRFTVIYANIGDVHHPLSVKIFTHQYWWRVLCQV